METGVTTLLSLPIPDLQLNGRYTWHAERRSEHSDAAVDQDKALGIVTGRGVETMNVYVELSENHVNIEPTMILFVDELLDEWRTIVEQQKRQREARVSSDVLDDDTNEALARAARSVSDAVTEPTTSSPTEEKSDNKQSKQVDDEVFILCFERTVNFFTIFNF